MAILSTESGLKIRLRRRSEVQQEEQRVTALLLRDARSKAEFAEEDGVVAYLEEQKRANRVDGRLLKGEVSQVRSFNRRSGIEPLPAPCDNFGTAGHREADALERDFLRTALQRREASWAAGNGPGAGSDPPNVPAGPSRPKRQRVGANGQTFDVSEAEAAEKKHAEEEAEFANPLLRPPPPHPAAALKATPGPVAPRGHERHELEAALWTSKGLRVRVVDENSIFKTSHLKKGIVRTLRVTKNAVDVELDDEKVLGSVGGGQLLFSVPVDRLETVVSKTCKQVEVVRGPHRGVIATLLGRDSRRNIALLRLGRASDEEQLELPLDDVCEFV